jgi:anti-sigma factor RsiW
MSGRSTEFDRSVQRFVDGEMTIDERSRFEARLADEHDLRAAVDELSSLRACFDAERAAPTPRPSAAFEARVLAEIRRAPLSRDGQPGDALAGPSLQLWGRRVVVAAMFVMGLALLVYAGLLKRVDTGHLKASPAEIQRVVERLDAKIREIGLEPAVEDRDK